MLDFICQKVLEINFLFLLESTCRLHFGAREEVLSETKEGNIRYFETDEKNSVNAVLDKTGRILETQGYDEFGVLTRSEVGNEQDSIFAYTGYEYEEV